MKAKLKILVLLLSVLFIGVAATHTPLKDRYFEITKNLEIFSDIYRNLNEEFVDDLDPNILMKIAIDAMMHHLDPYTRYYSESQGQSYRIHDSEKYVGLGAETTLIDSSLTIVQIFKDGPSYKSGLVVGDVILSVDGAEFKGRNIDEIQSFLRGLPGSEVNLEIRHLTGKVSTVVLIRDEVDIPNVPYSGWVSSDVGYIILTTFTENASKNIANAVRKLKDQNPQIKGLILDLRGNGGGLLNEAIDILGIFVPQGTQVVSVRGKIIEKDRNYRTKRMPTDVDIPIAVLINKQSASASEIVSGTLQDLDRAVIIGQRSYGKGLVQHFRDLPYNSRMKLTTAKYYIPSGRCIQSVEYENGEPKDVPDIQRDIYYTKNKRPVYDGGGVTPDIKLDKNKDDDYVHSIKENNLVHIFTNSIIQDNRVDTVSKIQYNDYDAFKEFLKKRKFNFKTNSETKLDEFSEALNNEGLSLIVEEIKSKKAIILKNKETLIDKNKQEILKLIESELAHRLFYENGKAQKSLDNDPEVKKAINILMDKSEYEKILKSPN